MQGTQVPSLVRELDPACLNKDPSRDKENPHATTKTQRSQINKYFFKRKASLHDINNSNESSHQLGIYFLLGTLDAFIK